MRETGCSHLPTGAHLLFYSPLHLQRHGVKQIYQGIIFTCWRYECTAPPSGHTQPNMEAIHGEMWDFLAVHLKVCLHSTEQPTAIINKWRLLILCPCVSGLKTYYLLVISVCICLCGLPERWHCQQAGTCDPPACWGTQPPGRQRAPDTLQTPCNTSCCCASLPCSAARSGGGQETSGSLLLSWRDMGVGEGIISPPNSSGKSLSEIKISVSENRHMLDKQVQKW